MIEQIPDWIFVLFMVFMFFVYFVIYISEENKKEWKSFKPRKPTSLPKGKAPEPPGWNFVKSGPITHTRPDPKTRPPKMRKIKQTPPSVRETGKCQYCNRKIEYMDKFCPGCGQQAELAIPDQFYNTGKRKTIKPEPPEPQEVTR